MDLRTKSMCNLGYYDLAMQASTQPTLSIYGRRKRPLSIQNSTVNIFVKSGYHVNELHNIENTSESITLSSIRGGKNGK